MSKATCSQCGKNPAEIKFRGSVICAGCLVGAAEAGVEGAQAIIERTYTEAVKHRAAEEKEKAKSARA